VLAGGDEPHSYRARSRSALARFGPTDEAIKCYRQALARRPIGNVPAPSRCRPACSARTKAREEESGRDEVRRPVGPSASAAPHYAGQWPWVRMPRSRRVMVMAFASRLWLRSPECSFMAGVSGRIPTPAVGFVLRKSLLARSSLGASRRQRATSCRTRKTRESPLGPGRRRQEQGSVPGVVLYRPSASFGAPVWRVGESIRARLQRARKECRGQYPRSLRKGRRV
jgi:hypothetical protein